MIQMKEFEKAVLEATTIIEYLDELYPDPPLLARARPSAIR